MANEEAEMFRERLHKGYAQSMELLGMTQFTPYGGGMSPLDRAWNDPELWKRK